MADAPTTPPYRTRLFALFARDAPKAVILRRGPKTHFHLVAWDLKRDVFTHGQWMKGHVELWDLSPRGDKIIYRAQQWHASAPWRKAPDPRGGAASAPSGPAAAPIRDRSSARHEHRRKMPRYMQEAARHNPPRPPVRRNEGVWTAISTPPYFTALAIWPSFGHWTGGGSFVTDHEILIHEFPNGMTPQANVPIPSKLRFLSLDDRREDDPPLSAWRDWMWDCDERAGVEGALAQAGAQWIEFIAPRENGDLLFACDGRVYRLGKWRELAPESYLEAARLLADFRGLGFTMLRAPGAAMRW